MEKKCDEIYQFKITLKGVRPPIWRRIQVPGSYSFRDLHIAIQNAMGWESYHSYDFYVRKVCIAADEGDFFIDDMWRNMPFYPRVSIDRIIPASKTKVKEFIKKEKEKITYLYDLGDYWEHTVILEKIIPREKDVVYPLCITGKRACPPEDCGGIGGYMDLIDIIENPNHPEHDKKLEWAGEEFDPESFDVDMVVFDKHDKRRKDRVWVKKQ